MRVLYLEMSHRVSLLSVNEIGKEKRIPDEKDRCVVPNEIPIALIGVELDGKASGVSGGVGRSRFAADGAEANSNWSPFAHRRKDRSLKSENTRMKCLNIGIQISTSILKLIEKHPITKLFENDFVVSTASHLAVFADIVSNFKVPEGSGSLGVDNAFRDALPVEVRHFIEERDVLEEDGASGSGRQGVQLVSHRSAKAGRHTIGFLEVCHEKGVRKEQRMK